MSGLVLKFQTNREMDVTTQEYQRDSSTYLGMKLAPIEEKMSQNVEWDEMDNDFGMTGVHTMDTDPKVKSRPGSKRKSFSPIPHKETELVKESELLNARALGTFGGVVNIEDLVGDAFKRGMGQDDVRIEWEIWQMFLGRLTINEPGYYLDEIFPIQSYDPLVPWDTLATAKPMADTDAIGQMFAGTGASGRGAVIYGNHFSITKLFQNKNADDLAGQVNENFRKTTYGLEDANKILDARGYPTFAEYDEGYYDANKSFVRFIPNGKFVCLGKRPVGQKIARYITTPSLHRTKNGMPAPGRFSFITVNGQPNMGGTTGVSLAQLGAGANPSIGVVHGVYGGPTATYPRSIIKINAF